MHAGAQREIREVAGKPEAQGASHRAVARAPLTDRARTRTLRRLPAAREGQERQESQPTNNFAVMSIYDNLTGWWRWGMPRKPSPLRDFPVWSPLFML